MKKTRCTVNQIIGILKQGEAGVKVKDICREHGISDATCYNWTSKCGGIDLKRLKETQQELSQLKRMSADMARENRALKELIDEQEMAKREDIMKGVFSGCHSEAWIEGHFTRLYKSIKITNHMTLQATKILS